MPVFDLTSPKLIHNYNLTCGCKCKQRTQLQLLLPPLRLMRKSVKSSAAATAIRITQKATASYQWLTGSKTDRELAAATEATLARPKSTLWPLLLVEMVRKTLSSWTSPQREGLQICTAHGIVILNAKASFGATKISGQWWTRTSDQLTTSLKIKSI